MDPHIASFIQGAERILAHVKDKFAKLQTGRANASVFEMIAVEAYGQHQPLKSLASISVQDARTIVIQPWDPSILQAIEKAVQKADIGSSPVNDGQIIRIVLPSLTTERREQMTKAVHALAEEARIALRKERQEAHDAIRNEKDEDVRETLQKELQKHVDAFNVKIDEARKKKEEETMKV